MADPQFNGILIDLDGTLIDAERFHERALNDAAWNESDYWEGFDASLWRHALSPDGGQRGRSRDRLLAYSETQDIPIGDAAVDEICAAKWDMYARALEHTTAADLDPRGHSLAVLDVLHNGRLPWGIVTDTPGRVALPIARILGVSAWVITKDDVGVEKPHPAIYELARKNIAVTRPIAIEDDLRGAHAASAAHIPVVLAAGPKEALRWLTEWILPGVSTTSVGALTRSRKRAGSS